MSRLALNMPAHRQPARGLVAAVATTAAVGIIVTGAACDRAPVDGPPRASGYVEATETRVSPRLSGRLAEVRVAEGDRVAAGDVIATLATTEIDLAIRRAGAERRQAAAALALLVAGARREDVDQAEAQRRAAAADLELAEADLAGATVEVARYERLVRNQAGAQKPLDDALARQAQAAARVEAARHRVAAADAATARLRAGARPEEIEAARAQVAAADVQIAALEHDRADATVSAPSAGIVETRLVEPGELIGAGQPIVVLIDLDRAWVNAFVEEPIVPRLRLAADATVVTDAGDTLAGQVTFISPRAEFTPRNVQTAEERAKLVYRVKVAVDNRDGVLKPGMPVDVRFGSGG